LKEAAIIDDRVMKALHEAIASEPKLKLASAGEPRVLQTV